MNKEQSFWKRLNYKRALGAFLLAYIISGIVGLVLYFILAILMGTIEVAGTPEFNVRTDPAYLLTEKLYVPENLLLWLGAGWLYFKKMNNKPKRMKEAIALGTLWLLIVLPLDFFAYVVVQSPYTTLSAEGFYIGQFPWIYFTYLTVFTGPLLYIALKKWQDSKRNK